MTGLSGKESRQRWCSESLNKTDQVQANIDEPTELHKEKNILYEV
jgi:hypothetical protein